MFCGAAFFYFSHILHVLCQITWSVSQYRFEVTVDDLLPVQHLQAPEQSVGEAADEGEAEALEVVFFDELIQVHPVGKKTKSKESWIPFVVVPQKG